MATPKKVCNDPISHWKFSETASEFPPKLGDPIQFVKLKFPDYSSNLEGGFYRLMGWIYDLRPFMKRYLYQVGIDSMDYREAYAPTITALRDKLRISKKCIILDYPEQKARPLFGIEREPK